MARYHINFEGKIYPCKAKVYKCPYGEEMHGSSQVELYYKLMTTHGADVEPSKMAQEEIKRTNRLKSLYSMSQLIEKVDYPVDVIVSSLREGLNQLENPKIKEEIEQWKKFEEDCIEDVRRAKLNGIMKFPEYIPENLLNAGRRRWTEMDNQKVIQEEFKSEEKRRRDAIMGRLEGRKGYYKEYERRDTKELNHKNYESTYAWMTADFERFSHDLNTSKMITQPMFYGSIAKAKQTIKNMDEYELLAAYDDYSVTDREIELAVKKANYFKYEYRQDLTEAANKSMETWYNRNREIYEKWKIDTPKRILLSMEIANELDSRGVLRQDLAIEDMMENKK